MRSGTPNHRKALTKTAKKHGVLVGGISNWIDLADAVAGHFGVARPAGEGPRKFCFDIMQRHGWISPLKSQASSKQNPIRTTLWEKCSDNRLRSCLPAGEQKQLVSLSDCQDFYRGRDWKEARDKILAVFGRSCMACNRSEKDGVIIQVDHIRPLKRYWSLRLELENLQVLCSGCNKEKASRSEIDLRPMPYDRAMMAIIVKSE